MTKYLEIGNEIKRARMTAQLSQRDLAKKLSFSASLLNQFEKGNRKPELRDAFRMEEILGVKDRLISRLVIAATYLEATGRKFSDLQLTSPKHGGGTESVGASSVQSGKVIEIGEIGGKKVRLRLDLE